MAADVPRHRHQWKSTGRVRTNLLGEVYEIYECTYPGCGETEERRK